MRKTGLAAAAVLLALAPPAGAKGPCGLKGGLKARISDCAKPLSRGGMGLEAKRVILAIPEKALTDPLAGMGEEARKPVWRLVTKTGSASLVWLDETTGLLWGEPAQAPADGDASRLCADEEVKGNLPLAFRLPTEDEFRSGLEDGLRSVQQRVQFKVFLVADKPGTYLDGGTGKFVNKKAAAATKRDLGVICVAASGRKPKPPKKADPDPER